MLEHDFSQIQIDDGRGFQMLVYIKIPVTDKISTVNAGSDLK